MVGAHPSDGQPSTSNQTPNVLTHPTSLHDEPYVEGRLLAFRHVRKQTARSNEHVQTDLVADAGLMQLMRQRIGFSGWQRAFPMLMWLSWPFSKEPERYMLGWLAHPCEDQCPPPLATNHLHSFAILCPPPLATSQRQGPRQNVRDHSAKQQPGKAAP